MNFQHEATFKYSANPDDPWIPASYSIKPILDDESRAFQERFNLIQREYAKACFTLLESTLKQVLTQIEGQLPSADQIASRCRRLYSTCHPGEEIIQWDNKDIIHIQWHPFEIRIIT